MLELRVIRNIFPTCNHILMIIGCWFLFKKCGVKRIWSFIPFAREYHMGLCADKEKEGRVFAIVSFFYYTISVILLLFEGPQEVELLLSIPLIALYVTNVIYTIRIYLGIIKIFGLKKKWIIPLIIFDGPTLILWGASSKYVPAKKVTQAAKNGAKELGKDIVAASEGLTVNITDRTVIDFFRKKTLLKDIHMVIPRGHMVLLLGGSGAGKTTLLNAVTGYEKANASVMLDENDVYKDYQKMKYDIGFVPQQDLMRGNDTVEMTLTDAALMRISAEKPYNSLGSHRFWADTVFDNILCGYAGAAYIGLCQNNYNSHDNNAISFDRSAAVFRSIL